MSNYQHALTLYKDQKPFNVYRDDKLLGQCFADNGLSAIEKSITLIIKSKFGNVGPMSIKELEEEREFMKGSFKAEEETDASRRIPSQVR